jgi:hypothetical protein
MHTDVIPNAGGGVDEGRVIFIGNVLKMWAQLVKPY